MLRVATETGRKFIFLSQYSMIQVLSFLLKLEQED